MDDTDILISGAGIAGMILAALLARQGRHVTICDPASPPQEMEAAGSDLRSTAYLVPSRRVLEQAGLWDHLAADAMPLEGLRVMNSTGWPPEQRAMRLFSPGDLDLEAFGWNVMNWRARKALGAALADHPGITQIWGAGFDGMLARDDAALVRLTDGRRIRARLVVGADGRNSPVREAAGIGVRSHHYGQKALAFAVTHDTPHGNISTEIYNDGGACVTVPMADHQGRPASSVVWMNHGRRALELSEMDQAAFDRELRLRTLSVLGAVERMTPLRPWPVITQTARRLTAKRTVLVAEAAHVLPPIGAQGLNTSISDLARLAETTATGDPGAPAALSAYARPRTADMHGRAAAIDLFNRLCQSDTRGVVALRSAGLKALHDTEGLRRRLMRTGLGG